MVITWETTKAYLGTDVGWLIIVVVLLIIWGIYIKLRKPKMIQQPPQQITKVVRPTTQGQIEQTLKNLIARKEDLSKQRKMNEELLQTQKELLDDIDLDIKNVQQEYKELRGKVI